MNIVKTQNGMMVRSFFAILIVFSFLCSSLSAQDNRSHKPRLLILTDIGGDPDDIQSLRRLLVYANEFQIEGIVATATWGPKGARKEGVFRTFEKHIDDAIDDYEQVRENLAQHAQGYPTADALRKVVKVGQADRGMDNVAPGRGTPGSQQIIDALDASEERLFVAIWGGAHDLAQALTDLRSTRSSAEMKRIISRLRIYSIGDQDKKFVSNGATGEWIWKNFPSIFYIAAGHKDSTQSSAGSVYRGIYQNDADTYGGSIKPLVKPGEELNAQSWVEENISKWGALGKNYPSGVNLPPRTGRNTPGVKEGDTPSWFYFLPHGLNDPSHPEWGGWGGRFRYASDIGIYVDAKDDHWSGDADSSLQRKWTVARWRESYQNDFAARMRWCVLPYDKANHNPVVVVDRDKTKNAVVRTVSKGESVKLDARDTYDPDGDKLTYHWWIYHEPSSSTGSIRKSAKKTATVEIPRSAATGDLHVILEVTDNGSPALKSFRRVILRVNE